MGLKVKSSKYYMSLLVSRAAFIMGNDFVNLILFNISDLSQEYPKSSHARFVNRDIAIRRKKNDIQCSHIMLALL